MKNWQPTPSLGTILVGGRLFVCLAARKGVVSQEFRVKRDSYVE
jgi:hypothetical protein